MLVKDPRFRDTFSFVSEVLRFFLDWGAHLLKFQESRQPPLTKKKQKSQLGFSESSAGMSQRERPKFYRQEVNKATWEVPERYQSLSPVGSGAYGSVW